jgi:hypothetical protein
MHQAELDDWEDRLPKCEFCGEPIDDYVYDIGGDIYCIDCMEEHFKKDAEKYYD